jgi:hypothetical protein
MHSVLVVLRWLLGRLAIALVALALAGRMVEAVRRGRRQAAERRRIEREVLPSLYDIHPGALTAPRRRLGVHPVPLDRIVGTLRHPSQNTADFLPLPELRGQNWGARWQRITGATNRLAVLPPVDLVKVGDDYYVEDGHNRVAAARQAGAIAIDADVTELVLPGQDVAPIETYEPTAHLGTDEVIAAAAGRRSPTAEVRPWTDGLTREELASVSDPAAEEHAAMAPEAVQGHESAPAPDPADERA